MKVQRFYKNRKKNRISMVYLLILWYATGFPEWYSYYNIFPITDMMKRKDVINLLKIRKLADSTLIFSKML